MSDSDENKSAEQSKSASDSSAAPQSTIPPSDADTDPIDVIVSDPATTRTILLSLLTFLAVVVALKAAQVVVVPLVMAIVLAMLLSPVAQWLKRLHVPYPIGAALILAYITIVTALGVYYLSEPAADWMTRLPETVREVEWKVRDIKQPLEKVTEATRQVEKMTEGAPDGTPTVEVRQRTLAEVLFNRTQRFLISTAVVVVLLYLLLASGDLFLTKLLKVQQGLSEKKRAMKVVHQIKHDVAWNLFVITAINIVLGLCVAGAMFLLGMPNPLLWGLMAATFNYIPYLGAIAGIVIIALVAFVTHDSLGQIVIPPSVYLVLTAIEGYFVTPMVLGARLSLNPVVIVVGLLFWSWLWGIPGAILAVPLLIIIRIVCNHISGLQPIGEFLGR